jgi:hypothetical protein
VNGDLTNKILYTKEFPNHKLKYAVPNDWKISEYWLETKQTDNWWVPEYQISIVSPDMHVNTKWPHPVSHLSSGPGAEIVIISYGSNNASSAEEWYKSRLDKTFPEVEHYGTIRYEDGTSASYTKTKFAGQDAYCAIFGNELDKNYSNKLAPEYSNCFILFGNLIYSISTRTNDQAPNYLDDVNKRKLILQSIKFVQ